MAGLGTLCKQSLCSPCCIRVCLLPVGATTWPAFMSVAREFGAVSRLPVTSLTLPDSPATSWPPRPAGAAVHFVFLCGPQPGSGEWDDFQVCAPRVPVWRGACVGDASRRQ